MSDSVRPHRRQPTRLPCSWDSPGKNTGVDCHCLLQCMKVKSEREVAQSCRTLRDPMDCSLPGSSAHGIFQARVLEWGAIAFSEGPLSLPKLQNLMPDDLRGADGIIIEIKCTINVMSLNHPQNIPLLPKSLGTTALSPSCRAGSQGSRKSDFGYQKDQMLPKVTQAGRTVAFIQV